MHIRGLVLLLFVFPGGARRSIRVDDSHRDAQQQSNAFANGLDLSVEAQDALIPGGSHQGHSPRFRSGPRRVKVALHAADGPEEDQLPMKAGTRREVLAKTGAALASAAAVQSASAKAGQFSKIDVFSIAGTPAISSPYQPGGPKAGPDATYGYKKTDGDFLAKDYQNQIDREMADFDKSKRIIRSLGPNIDSKTWWLVRDNLRGQAYNMKANMEAINNVLAPEKKRAANDAYKKFWKKVDRLDIACQKKELSLAQTEYEGVLDALKTYEQVIYMFPGVSPM